MYNLVIQSYTQRSHITNGYHRGDIVSDYKPEYFIPLMILTKNIIELIDFLHEEI
jgi:hypothetical protein